MNYRGKMFYNTGFRGLWILMEGGLMKHFCKGTSTKIVEEYDEKIEKLLKVGKTIKPGLKFSVSVAFLFAFSFSFLFSFTFSISFSFSLLLSFSF